MSESTFKFSYDGQEVEQSDFQRIAENAGLADDRVFAELQRMTPSAGGAPGRMVLPYGSPNDTAGTVAPTGAADGTIGINPFRAFIGSRVTAGTDAVKNWRDIRSAIFTGSATSLQAHLPIAANASGNPRWDLVYATVSVDQDAATSVRFVKDVTGAVAAQNVPAFYSTNVSINVLTGTPSTSPALPATPADSGLSYIIPLAYVAVPNAWTSTSQCASWQIFNIAAPSPSGFSKIGGANLSTPNAQPSAAQLAAWANGTTTSVSARPQWLLNPEMRGSETLIVPIDTIGTGALWSHTSLGLVDNSRDWRGRLFKTTIFAGFGGPVQTDYSWARQNAGNTTKLVPGYAHNATTPEAMATNVLVQFGQTFRLDAANLPGSPPSGSIVCFVDSSILGGGSFLSGGLGLYVDTSGALRVYINGTANNARMFFWVESSGPLPNW